MRFQGVWPPTQISAIVQVPWPNSYSLGQLLARDGEKPEEGMEEVGLDDKYLGTGRINHTGVGNLIQGGDTGSFSILVRYVGDNPSHGPGPGKVPE